MALSILQETGGTKNLRAFGGETFDTQVCGNSANGVAGLLILSYRRSGARVSRIPPTALVGFGTRLRESCCRQSMNDPPTALVGFGTRQREPCCRQGMNDPPTALVGFGARRREPCCRQSMNNPPTALVGFGTSKRFLWCYEEGRLPSSVGGIYGLIFENAAARISSIGGSLAVHNANCNAA